MESRKRAFDGDAPISVKKRAISSMNDSPVAVVANSRLADEPQDENELELFRKEAVYRRMRHYSRELDKSQALISQLQARSATCEATLIAISACWDQLLQQVHLLSQSCSNNTQTLGEGVLDLYSQINDDESLVPKYTKAIKEKASASKTILENFVSIAPQAPAPEPEELRNTCMKLQTQNAATKSELVATRANYIRAKNQAEKYKSSLTTAEDKLDRLRSTTLQKLETSGRSKDIPIPNGTSSPKPETPKVESMVAVNGVSNGDDDWHLIAEERQKSIENLREDLSKSSAELTRIRLELASPAIETLRSYEGYKHLQTILDSHVKSETALKAELALLKAEVERLNREKEEHQTRVLTESHIKINELKSMVEKRDSDLHRLRDMRDALTSELHERKSKDSERTNGLGQIKILANARAERITMLVSENQRLKARLAAREGEEGFFAFILSKPQDESFVRELQEKLELLKREKTALEATLKSIDANNPDTASTLQLNAELRENLSVAEEKLRKLEAMFGAGCTNPEVAIIAEQLRSKEEELRRLRLELKASLEEPSALYTEIERLSALWESLDKQVKDKVLDLSSMEERLAKAVTEKAKADNKYFATMRQKDAADAERKNLQRQIEKQTKVIERLAESEKNLTLQLSQMEKDSILAQKRISERENIHMAMHTKIDQWKSQYEAETKRSAELQSIVQERESTLAKSQAENLKHGEEVVRLKKEHERQLIKARASHSNGREAELAQEVDKLMNILKCSACKIELRSHVLIKCMHTFCKDCIDARLATRQRKCPACQHPFGNNDVQQLFFQG